ncbi:hypothetical protein D0Q02_12915 [Micromonospora craniellae]|uniref:Diadenosine tetraphosphate hydrolase n=1 Tax=Micromonospora craniellae TaxID=2294034 RepID=A0A372FZ38_9ACTN|nr:hypothetical protein [Micromonospora craniellae]QOC94526.1 hypothetical protein ID554_13750 [Micromonospora craniellae]RFS46057.1 hypothetical protein D0Q02_12915 [Micromonospora craniellae]
MHDTPPSVPDFTQWPSFPFEGDLQVKRLDEPVLVEPPRKGEAHRECTACQAPDEAYIWVGERWRVRAMDRPTGLPMVLILESRSHLDLGDLPNLLAAELGVMTVRLERAIRSLDGVARVHVNRWGDGSAHLHLWFLARPYGRLQLRGTFLSLWDSILPPISEDKWRENLALVAAWLAEFGGRPLAEPPRIQWQAPSSLAAQAAPAKESQPTEGGSLLDAIGETAEPPDVPLGDDELPAGRPSGPPGTTLPEQAVEEPDVETTAAEDAPVGFRNVEQAAAVADPAAQRPGVHQEESRGSGAETVAVAVESDSVGEETPSAAAPEPASGNEGTPPAK